MLYHTMHDTCLPSVAMVLRIYCMLGICMYYIHTLYYTHTTVYTMVYLHTLRMPLMPRSNGLGVY